MNRIQAAQEETSETDNVPQLGKNTHGMRTSGLEEYNTLQ